MTKSGSTLIPCLRYRDTPAMIEWLCRSSSSVDPGKDVATSQGLEEHPAAMPSMSSKHFHADQTGHKALLRTAIPPVATIAAESSFLHNRKGTGHLSLRRN